MAKVNGELKSGMIVQLHHKIALDSVTADDDSRTFLRNVEAGIERAHDTPADGCLLPKSLSRKDFIRILAQAGPQQNGAGAKYLKYFDGLQSRHSGNHRPLGR